MVIGKRLLNKPLHREAPVKQTCGKVTVCLLLSLIYENVSNKALDLQIQSEAVRLLLSLIYENVSVREEDLQIEIEEAQKERDNLKKQWLHWRSFPVDEAWKDDCCTITWSLSGREFLVLNKKKLAELKTLRKLYQHVRECAHLQNNISLRLTYCGSRLWKPQWKEHIVHCNDSDCTEYLRGATLQAIVHP